MPFSIEQFFEVFARYNLAVWPLQIVAFLAGIVVVLLLWSNSRGGAAMIAVTLSAMWLVNGIGFHWLYFSTINPAARLFAAVFILQAALLAFVAFAGPEVRFRSGRGPVSVFGLICIAFALVFYPVVGWLFGHRYPAVPMFGIAPCPTTIFTVGVLLQAQWRRVRWLLVIPGLWAGLGGSASFLLGVRQDYALFAILPALVILAFGHWRGWKSLAA